MRRFPAPSTGTVTLGYVTTNDTVTGIKVTWTPSTAGDYDITVKAGGTVGTLNVPSSGTVQRTDTVTIASRKPAPYPRPR